MPLIVQLAIVSVALLAFWARLRCRRRELAELPLIVQLAIVSVALPSESAMLPMPPPPKLAELPLIVQLLTVSVGSWLKARLARPPPKPAELPLIVQLVTVSVARVADGAAAVDGRIAAERAVGDCQRRAAGGVGEVGDAAAAVAGRVAAERAVGDRQRGSIIINAAAGLAKRYGHSQR